MRSDYNKPEALEYIFHRKYDPDNPQPKIPFTHDDVRNAIERRICLCQGFNGQNSSKAPRSSTEIGCKRLHSTLEFIDKLKQ